MATISPEQKKSRQEWRERLKYYISCTKLDHDDAEYWHPSELVELIYDIPEYDLGKADKKKFLNELGVEE